MRLLRRDGHGNLSLTKDLEKDIPPYAILSHTWLPDDGAEVDFEDIADGIGATKDGYEKLQFCGNQAAKDNLEHFWVDTCCINRSNESELSQAIRSMFRWYRDAVKCYVYLYDVRTLGDDAQQWTWKSDFPKSRWFERGWTLQELLAPTSVEFFSREGKRLGDRQSLQRQIHESTKIPIAALQGSHLSSFGIQERLLWAEHRQTTREEDSVYSLLGLFGIHIPILYGEGKDNALRRLLREIQSGSNSPSETKLTPSSTIPFRRDQDFVGRETLQVPPAQLAVPGSGTTTADSGDIWSVNENSKPPRTWLGDTCTEVHPNNYNHWRGRLSNSAYSGNWYDVWKALDVGIQEFGESWVNAVRIKPLNQVDNMSFWTPLHQAVYNEAPVEVVQRLLDLGAFRTLRTRITDLSEQDMTPLDLAYDLKRTYLFDLLSPVTRSPVPFTILSALEAQFHAQIRRDLGNRVEENRMYLPQLEVLTESQMGFVWFPVNLGPFKAGYAFELIRRELLVRAINIPTPRVERTYRITENKTEKTEERFFYGSAR